MGDMETTSLSDSDKTTCCAMCWPIKWRSKTESSGNRNSSTFSGNLHSEKDNPAFIGDLPDPLLPGHCIKITGKPQKDCERFAINFKCNSNENSDITFHFNPRLAENYIVRNSRQHGKWQSEHTQSLLRPDIKRNVTFIILFFVAPREFMVSVNGQHFCTFPYRMPVLKTRIVEVRGNVVIDDVEIIEMTSYPTEDLPKPVPFDDDNKNQILPNPFIGHLNKGFQSGWQLEIYGKVKILPHSFYINLQKGSFLWPHPIIPLHLNPRFNTGSDNRVLIRNNWDKDTWGAEERSPGFYFLPSKPFHLIIQLDMQKEIFIVLVNGKLQGEFRIRNMNNANAIDTVYIEGDLYIYKVFMKTNHSDFNN